MGVTIPTSPIFMKFCMDLLLHLLSPVGYIIWAWVGVVGAKWACVGVVGVKWA